MPDDTLVLREHARLCRALALVLHTWRRARGLSGTDAALVNAMAHAEDIYQTIAARCQCDPAGSGEEWCTGHCEEARERYGDGA